MLQDSEISDWLISVSGDKSYIYNPTVVKISYIMETNVFIGFSQNRVLGHFLFSYRYGVMEEIENVVFLENHYR